MKKTICLIAFLPTLLFAAQPMTAASNDRFASMRERARTMSQKTYDGVRSAAQISYAEAQKATRELGRAGSGLAQKSYQAGGAAVDMTRQAVPSSVLNITSLTAGGKVVDAMKSYCNTKALEKSPYNLERRGALENECVNTVRKIREGSPPPYNPNAVIINPVLIRKYMKEFNVVREKAKFDQGIKSYLSGVTNYHAQARANTTAAPVQ